MDLLNNFEAIENAQNTFRTHIQPTLIKNQEKVDLANLEEQLEKYEEMVISILGIEAIDNAANLLKKMFEDNTISPFFALLKVLATFYHPGYRFILTNNDVKKRRL